MTASRRRFAAIANPKTTEVERKEHEQKPDSAEELEQQETEFGDDAAEQWDDQKQDADAEKVKLEQELSEQRDKYLRLVAEFDNYRKRIARERVELMQTASKEVITSLLEVLDDSDRAIQQMESTDDVNIVKEGALLIFNKLRNRLQSFGLKELDSIHQDFDAELHDAIAEVPAPSKDLVGKVIDSVQKGYYLNDKLIRHAKVVVGK
jgi:molecular chaperone GrpE